MEESNYQKYKKHKEARSNIKVIGPNQVMGSLKNVSKKVRFCYINLDLVSEQSYHNGGIFLLPPSPKVVKSSRKNKTKLYRYRGRYRYVKYIDMLRFKFNLKTGHAFEQLMPCEKRIHLTSVLLLVYSDCKVQRRYFLLYGN